MPQIDSEALGIYFASQGFRHSILGFPEQVMIVKDHQSLCSVFNEFRKGSI